MFLIQKNSPMKLNSFLSSPLIKNTLKLSSSNVLMYLLPLIVTPILSRLFTPEDFGDWGVFSSVLSIIGIIICLGYENAIVKAQTDEDALNMGLACGIISLIVSIIVYTSFSILKSFDVKFFVDFPSVNLLTSCLFTASWFHIFSNICNRFEKYSTLAFSSIMLGGSQALFRIFFGIISITFVNGLILGTTLAQISNAIYFIIVLYPLFKMQDWSCISKIRMRELIKINKNFPLFDAPASLLAFSAFNLPIVILSLYFEKAEIGCYSIIIQLLLMPMSFIGSAMGKVYYKQLVDCNDSIKDAKLLTQKVLQITSTIAVLPMLCLALGGDYLIVKFLGSKWSNSGDIALCLSLWSFATILSQPLISVLRWKNKQNRLLVNDLIYCIGGIGSLLVMLSIHCDLLVTILVYAIVCSFAKFALFHDIISCVGINFCEIPRYTKILWFISLLILIIRLCTALA